MELLARYDAVPARYDILVPQGAPSSNPAAQLGLATAESAASSFIYSKPTRLRQRELRRPSALSSTKPAKTIQPHPCVFLGFHNLKKATPKAHRLPEAPPTTPATSAQGRYKRHRPGFGAQASHFADLGESIQTPDMY